MPTPTPTKYKLKLKTLRFISAVDRPAQETARAAIIKRHDGGGDDVTATFRFAKADDTLGIVFGWALTSTVDGSPYFDLQGDNVSEDDLVKVAADYAAQGGAVDEMHDEQPGAGQCVFLFPMTSEIAKALGIDTDTTGLLAGLKVAPDVLARFKSGDLGGFSIGGTGEREQLDDAQKSAPTEKSAPASASQLAEQMLKAAVTAYQSEHGIRSYEEAFAKATGEDPATRAAYEAVAKMRAAEAPRYVAPSMPPNTAAVVKDARVAVAKCELELRRVVTAYQKAHGFRTYDEAMATATHNDPAARKAYEDLADARERLLNAPMRAVTAKIDGEIAQLRKSLDEQVESFCLRHNVTPLEARDRLTEISPTYKRTLDRVLQAGHERQVAADRARMR